VIRFVSFLLLPVLLVLALPATAQAVWTAPETLSPAGRFAFNPDVDIDQSGNAVFVWVRRDGTSDCGGSPGCNRIQLVARSAGGTLSAVQDISPPGLHAMKPQVRVDPNGNAVIAWYGHSQLGTGVACTDCSFLTRARSADGTLSTTQTLAPAGEAYASELDGVFPELGVDQSGNAVFAWVHNDETTNCSGSGCYPVARARSATGTLSATQIVVGPPAGQPEVAVEPDGDAVFVWSRRVDGTTGCGGVGCPRVQTRVRSASGQLSAIQTLTPGGQAASVAQVGVDQAGNAVVVWTQRDGIQARVRYADGTLSPIQTLAPPQGAVKVAFNQAGDAAVIWQLNTDGTTSCAGQGCARIQGRVRHADGTLAPIQTLSPSGQHAYFADVGIDQSGNAIFAWQRYDGMGGPPCLTTTTCFRVQARVRSATGALSATKTLSAAGVDSVYPQLAVNGAGNAALTWTRNSKPFSRVQAAFGP
jgi:hypothetical protein